MDQCTAHLAQCRCRLFSQKSHAIATIPLPFCLLQRRNTRCQPTKQSVTSQEQEPKVQTKKSPQINIETNEMLRFAHKEHFWVTKATGHFVLPNKKEIKLLDPCKIEVILLQRHSNENKVSRSFYQLLIFFNYPFLAVVCLIWRNRPTALWVKGGQELALF